MNNNEIINNLINEVKKQSMGLKPIDFFMKIKDQDITRLELMIMDSVLKNMPMGRLHNTLLLSEEKFLTMVENIIEKLTSFKH